MKYTRRVYVDTDAFENEEIATPIAQPQPEMPEAQPEEPAQIPAPLEEPVTLPDAPDAPLPIPVAQEEPIAMPDAAEELPTQNATDDIIVDPVTELEIIIETPQAEHPAGKDLAEDALEKMYKIYQAKKEK